MWLVKMIPSAGGILGSPEKRFRYCEFQKRRRDFFIACVPDIFEGWSITGP